MDIVTLIGIIGSLVSIISAIVSFYLYRKNRTIRDELIVKQDISFYSDLKTNIDETINILKKIALKKTPIRGISKQQVINSLQDIYEILNNSKNQLNRDGYNEIDTKITEIGNTMTQLHLLGDDIASYQPKVNDLYYLFVNINSEIIKMKSYKILK